jgi:transcription termination factor Rho
MASVLERSELEASPLADLHAIADQLGLDGFRRLRKADLIDRILGEEPKASEDAEDDSAAQDEEEQDSPARSSRSRGRRRGGRTRRPAAGDTDDDAAGDGDTEAATDADTDTDTDADEEKPAKRSRSRRGGGGRSRAAKEDDSDSAEERETGAGPGGELAEGVVEVLGNGSAFLRIDPPEPSDGDVYISAAQVRRCELVSGDRVAGPVRTPRRSERYPSLVRIDTINGDSADAVSAGARYEDLPVEYPSERFALEASDPTLQAIEWLTPFGRGSRVVIVGGARSGKSETLRALLHAISKSEGIEASYVLVGARPEEIGLWGEGDPSPAAALSFAASADSQSQAVERALDAGKRVAARGGNAVVLIDSLDGLQPHAARKALATARNLREGGSLTVIATATQPLGGEGTVIALDVALTATGRQPILDLTTSGTLRPELLVGEDGAQAILKARAEALDVS